MNKKFQIAIAVVVIAAAGGAAWYYQGQVRLAAITNKVQDVSSDTPVKAITGKKITMAIKNTQSNEVTVTVPGLDSTPRLVAAGADAKLDYVAQAPGTYTIIETS